MQLVETYSSATESCQHLQSQHFRNFSVYQQGEETSVPCEVRGAGIMQLQSPMS